MWPHRQSQSLSTHVSQQTCHNHRHHQHLSFNIDHKNKHTETSVKSHPLNPALDQWKYNRSGWWQLLREFIDLAKEVVKRSKVAPLRAHAQLHQRSLFPQVKINLIESLNSVSPAPLESFRLSQVSENDVILAVSYFRSQAKGEGGIPQNVASLQRHLQLRLTSQDCLIGWVVLRVKVQIVKPGVPKWIFLYYQ